MDSVTLHVHASTAKSAAKALADRGTSEAAQGKMSNDLPLRLRKVRKSFEFWVVSRSGLTHNSELTTHKAASRRKIESAEHDVPA